MRDKLSDRVLKLKGSATLGINSKVKELKRKGIDVINLSVGEPDFDTPIPIKEEAISGIREGFTKYTEPEGTFELREAICEKLLRENSLSYTPEQIVVSNGAKHSIFNTLLATLNPGDEVIIPAPYWVSYPAMVKIAGGKPVFCKWNDEFKIDIDHLKSLINKRTKLIILNSPCNPTGIVYTRKELEEIAEIIVENNILCISDEIYEKIVYDVEHVSIASIDEEVKRRTILVNGVSKTFAMTGWRIGYIAADIEISKAVKKIQSQTTSCPSSVSQKAAISAIKWYSDISKIMVEEFKRRRDYILRNISEKIPYLQPQGTFYIFLNIGNSDSEKVAKKLLEEKHVAVVPGKDFGAEGFLRVSFATDIENIKEGIKRINEFAEENL